MSFAAPIWIAIAGLVAAGVVIAHLITTSQPRRDVLPTARFIPQTAPLTVTRTRRPADLLLLFARLIAIALLGLALAGAHVTRSAPAQVILADVSRAAADSGAVLDSVRAIAVDNAVVVVFGNTASPAPSTLSGGLVAAHRAIAGRDGGERTELVIVSPLAREQVDSATGPLIALWPGPVKVSRALPAIARVDTSLEIRSSGDDPVAAALSMSAPTGRARIFRSALPAAADTAWARDSAGMLVVWPADLASGGLTLRSAADTQQGMSADGNVVIGTFVRAHTPRDGRAVIRWLDGEPAATETPLGAGCVREVAIPVDAAGDVALRESFRGVVKTLTSPCGGARDLAPADLATLLPTDGRSRAASVAGTGRLAVWLALAAVAVLFLEQLFRRRQPA